MTPHRIRGAVVLCLSSALSFAALQEILLALIPTQSLARSWSNLEAVTGQLFPATQSICFALYTLLRPSRKPHIKNAKSISKVISRRESNCLLR